MTEFAGYGIAQLRYCAYSTFLPLSVALRPAGREKQEIRGRRLLFELSEFSRRGFLDFLELCERPGLAFCFFWAMPKEVPRKRNREVKKKERAELTRHTGLRLSIDL